MDERRNQTVGDPFVGNFRIRDGLSRDASDPCRTPNRVSTQEYLLNTYLTPSSLPSSLVYLRTSLTHPTLTKISGKVDMLRLRNFNPIFSLCSLSLRKTRGCHTVRDMSRSPMSCPCRPKLRVEMGKERHTVTLSESVLRHFTLVMPTP